MSLQMSKYLFKNLNNLKIVRYASSSKLQTHKKHKLGQLVISSKRKNYDFYKYQNYDKFDEVVLVSKGWNHSKAKGDYFIVHSDPEEIDKPIIPFSSLGIHPDLLKVLNERNITDATTFQSNAIPVIGSGKHTLIAAETGCGKTYAYLLPIIQNLIKNNTDALNTPKVLILVPNRELAYQVGAIATSLGNPFDLKVQVTVGGQTKRLMMNAEFAPIDILVGTPGAIGKLSTVGIYKLHNVKNTVLDEADTLVDDSFVERMEGIIKRVPQSQIILASATLPKKIPAILEPIIENLVQIKSDRLHKPLLNIAQRFLRLPKSGKPSHLLKIAKSAQEPLIVFSNRNETCNWVALFLRENGLKCANINGDMNHAIRIEQWKSFVNGSANILSATDVGSRGLDTTQVMHVLNYDFPTYVADYIHRIGRTGRLGSSEFSKVTNFISVPMDVQLVQQIELAIRTNSELKNVDGNISNIVQKRILQKIRENS